MRAGDLEVRTAADGSVIIHPRASVTADGAVELRQLLVRTVRHERPLRLVLDLSDVATIDAINLGTLAAVCTLGDDHQVAVFLDNAHPALAQRLRAAGVPSQRLRHS